MSGCRELGDEAQLRQAILRGERHRRDAERADAGVAVHGQTLAHASGGPHSETLSISASGIAAIASSRLPSRYRS